jgi:transposase
MYKFYAGCDTHKATHHIVIINQAGQAVESFEIDNFSTGWIKAVEVFNKYEGLLLGIENHANYAKLFAKFLIGNEIQLKEVNPVFTGKKRKASTRRNKTDEIDALVIAKITRDEQKHLPDIIIDEKKEEVKALSDHRENAVKDKVRTVNRLHATLMQFDTSYKKRYGDDLTNRSALSFIKNDFSKNSNIQSKLILCDIEKLIFIMQEIEEYDEMIKMYVKNDKLAQNLDSISGVGEVFACKLIAEIGEISKFKNVDKFCSYAGLIPVKFSSGNYSKDIKNRGGRKELKTTIKKIVQTQLLHCKTAKKYYEKKIKDGKSIKEAKICLCKQIAKIIYFIYKNNVPYNSKIYENIPKTVKQGDKVKNIQKGIKKNLIPFLFP